MLGKKKAMALGLALLVALGAAGCSKKTAAPGGAVKVKVMQAINIIRHGYNRLTDVQQAAQIWGVSQNDFLDCINFLALAKYIQLRTIMDKVLVPDFADIEWTLLEVRLTDTGIRVLQGNIKDDMIEV